MGTLSIVTTCSALTIFPNPIGLIYPEPKFGGKPQTIITNKCNKLEVSPIGSYMFAPDDSCVLFKGDVCKENGGNALRIFGTEAEPNPFSDDWKLVSCCDNKDLKEDRCVTPWLSDDVFFRPLLFVFVVYLHRSQHFGSECLCGASFFKWVAAYSRYTKYSVSRTSNKYLFLRRNILIIYHCHCYCYCFVQHIKKA